MSSSRRFFPRMQVHLPGVDIITLLAIVIILIQVWLDWEGGPFEKSAQKYYLELGLSWDGISHFKFWQIVTHALTHGSWFHLCINLLMLWLVGGRVIHILGQRRFAVIVLAGMLFGGILHVVTDFILIRNGYPGTQLVGISGACFALLITLTTLSPDSRMWPFPVSGKNLGLGLILAELLLWLMTPAMEVPFFSRMGEVLVSWGGAGLFLISHACHLGGAVAGWWLARRLLSPSPNLEDLQRARARHEAEMELGDAG